MTDTIIKIAGVRFRENWKVYDFDATDLVVAIGDKIIVDSERGQGLATVVRLKKQIAPPAPEPVQLEHGLQIEEESPSETAPDASANGNKPAPKVLRKVLRKATGDDLARDEKNKGLEAEAFKTAQDMIAERELPMKLIRVEYSFDVSRATFYFFSESRIDFRELVKDLAYKLHSRIEMRQIGVRDVARLIGGFGPCGRELGFFEQPLPRVRNQSARVNDDLPGFGHRFNLELLAAGLVDDRLRSQLQLVAFGCFNAWADDYAQAQIDAVLQEDAGKITGHDNQLMPL